MSSFWPDLQEAFYIALGPYLAYLLSWLFVGSGLVLGALMLISRWWKRPDPQPVIFEREE